MPAKRHRFTQRPTGGFGFARTLDRVRRGQQPRHLGAGERRFLQEKRGDAIVLDDRPVFLVLYGTGIRNRSSVGAVQATIGGVSVPVEYAGPEGSGIPGLDQVTVRLTSDLKGIGLADLVVTVDGIPSNTVTADVR